MEPILYCYNRCSTCRKAYKFLEDHDISYTKIPIYETPPSEEDFLKYFKESGLPSKRFFNTSGVVYREMDLKNKLVDMNDEERAKLLSSDGKLVKRPLLVYENKVYPGFKEEAWSEILDIH